MSPISLMDVAFCLKNESCHCYFCKLLQGGRWREGYLARLLAASLLAGSQVNFLWCQSLLYVEASGSSAKSLQREANHSLALGSAAINQPFKRKTCCLIKQLKGNWLLV